MKMEVSDEFHPSKAEQQLVQLPEKLLNERKIKNADQAQLVLNAYRLVLKNSIERVYKHELKFVAVFRSGEKEKVKDLSVGPKNDVASRTRHRLLWELYEQMVKTNIEFFGGKENSRCIVYDCGINFYSQFNPLPRGSTKEFILNKEDLSEKSKAYLGRNAASLTATLLACETIELHNIEAALEARDHSVVQFLEILSNQQLFKEDEYYFFGNRMFSKKSAIKLQNDPRVLKEGFQKNVRFVGDSVEDAFPLIQIDPKKSAFFPEGYIHHFLEDFLPGRGDLESNLQNNTGIRNALHQIKGLSVRTTHLADNRTFVVNGLTTEDADHLTFEKEGRQISVTEYFKAAYDLRLRHPRLPCIIEKRPKIAGAVKQSFYPMEVLKIVAGQRVSLDKQTPQLTEQMIRNCQALPAKFRSAIEQQKGNAFISNSNPFFKAHGVGVEPELVSANAEVLFPPAIVYERDREEPNQRGEMQWKLPMGRRFVAPAAMPKVWVAVVIERGVQTGACEEFISRIVDSAKRRGLSIEKPQRFEMFDRSDIDYIREKFAFFKQHRCLFVMFFTKDKLDPVHHTMKLMEVEFEITTQHICAPAMQKAIGNKGAFLVLDNILMKTNLKLGGVNHTLATAGEMQRRNRNITHDIVGKEWLAQSRMFIGIDMSHAGSQSLYEKQSGVQGDPTIVGMSYTIGHPLKMLGTYWIQESRVAYAQNMVKPLVKALTRFKQETGSYPRHIVVFRGGVSEGEFRIVVTHEESAFRKAFDEIIAEKCKGGDSGSFRIPELTIIVVQRNSNYRIVPFKVDERARPFEQNVRPGTVVDANSMHPAYTEFLMVGHKAIQGTANPVRCTVIWDSTKGRIPLEDLEYMTYSMCYAHGVVTSSVSVPAPLYSASDLAKRGRNNWKTGSINGSTNGSARDDESSNDYYVEMSNKFEPKILTKFWA